MGWDAYAIYKNGRGVKNYKKFEKVADEIKATGCEVDGFLRFGALDCSDCGFALEEMTRQSVWVRHGWTPEMVKEYFNWIIPEDINEKWNYQSAYHFLKICAENGYGIRFSY